MRLLHRLSAPHPHPPVHDGPMGRHSLFSSSRAMAGASLPTPDRSFLAPGAATPDEDDSMLHALGPNAL